MILQKSFEYADLLHKKHFVLLSMLKTVVLFNYFVETMILVFQDPLMNRNVKKTAFI